MLEALQVTQTQTLITAMIRLTVPRREIREVMGPGIQEVMQAIAAHGITPAEPWFTHHLREPQDFFDFEICVPAATPVQPGGPSRARDIGG